MWVNFVMSYFVPKLPQKDTFNIDQKNAKNWCFRINKYRQKAKNYLKMTNIDKKLRLTSKVQYNITKKSENWSKINSIYELNVGLLESVLCLLKPILGLWDSILSIRESILSI